MMEKTSPMMKLFDKQLYQAKSALNSLNKNFKSKKALDLSENLIFLNIYLDLLNRVHFHEERLQFQLFEPFKPIHKALKRIRSFKLIQAAFEQESTAHHTAYNTYKKSLTAERKELYKEAYEVIFATPLDMWESLYASIYNYERNIGPLQVDTATLQLVNEEIDFFQFRGKNSQMDSQSLKELMEGIRIITAVENLRIALGMNTIFTDVVHEKLAGLREALNRWHQTHLFGQHLQFFLGENVDVGPKYIDLAKRTKANKQRLTKEVASLYHDLFSKLTS